MSACGQCHGHNCNNQMPMIDDESDENSSCDEDDGNIFENLFAI